MPTRFVIAANDVVPIYRQILDQVRRQIAGGQLRTGDELPSVRAVAQEHAVNPMTVSKAYSMLETEGLLERRRGMGMVVAASPLPKAKHRLPLLEPVLSSAAQQAAQLGLNHDEALALFQRCLTQHHPEGATPTKDKKGSP